MLTKRCLNFLAGLLLISPLIAGTAWSQEKLQKIKFGFATKSISPLVINLIIPEYLGYYKAEGMTVETIPLGSNAAAMAAIDTKQIDFAVGTASFMLPLLAQGEKLPGINFFEYTYPFKYGLAVSPGGKIKSITDLKGKRMGISGLGSTDYPVGQAVIKIAGLDPSNDVSWLSVGEGIPAGIALQRGNIDGLFYYDTAFGAIEAAGIKLDYLSLPAAVPKVGGIYLMAQARFLSEKRSVAVGFARAVAKAQVFIRENPEAAAYIFARMIPEATPKGVSEAEQVKAIMGPVVKRMPIYAHYDKSITKWGYIKASEWQDETKFLGLEGKVKDASLAYTNDLIDDINKFDAEKVRQEARNFKLPYKK